MGIIWCNSKKNWTGCIKFALSKYLNQIHQATNSLKLLEASQISRNIKYARQWYFDFRDKPWNMLAKVLEENTPIKNDIGINNAEGQLVYQVEQKLRIFERYYVNLCKSEKPQERDIKLKLKSLLLPEIAADHKMS